MVAQAARDSGLVRPRQGRWIAGVCAGIAGVCAGIADRFEMSRKTVRLLFVLSTILPGPQFIVYIGLWLVIPSDE